MISNTTINLDETTEEPTFEGEPYVDYRKVDL
jgi:hypothetical protein